MELTEAMLVRQVSRSLSTMQDLHALGVGLVLDDFGTGFSSVAHLARFPIQGVKVDRSFVRDAGQRPDADAVIAGAAGLARGLGLRVVAEGVETQAQARRVRELGCDQAQGHYFGLPVRAEGFAEQLAALNVATAVAGAGHGR
jgi:EAL domain-containing protein (putative c-di-GMP-specific phosphodiesterase class I)